MISLADSGKKELSIVDDQIGSPTYTYDLSKLMCDMMVTDKYGTIMLPMRASAPGPSLLTSSSRRQD
jgi:dTDP-4-dehydrorhamnose reductase